MQKASIVLYDIKPVINEGGKIVLRASGFVYDHPKFFDGQYIITSAIQKINTPECKEFTTYNTVYTVLSDHPFL